MKNAVPVVLGLLFAAAMVANIAWAVHALHQEEEHAPEKHEESKRLTRDESGNAVLKLEKAMQERAALQVEELREASLPDETRAYGRFVEDPSRSFTLRAPIPGIVRAGDGGWPRLGTGLADGAPVGLLQPRFSPLERVDLQSRLTAAQAETASASASLEAAKASLDRLKILNTENKTVSDRSLQEAYTKVKTDAARLTAATETAAAIEAALGARSGATGPVALVCERGGEVLEVLVQPGEAVESGQALLRVARFDRLLARAALPVGEHSAAASARILPLGRESAPLKGERVGRAPTDPQLPGDAAYYAVDVADSSLRPGMPFTAFLAEPGEASKGVLLPRAAVLRVEGARWAWIQTGEEAFTRREVPRSRPVEGGWFVTEGFRPGEKVVTAGAQLLLSEELKSKIQSED